VPPIDDFFDGFVTPSEPPLTPETPDEPVAAESLPANYDVADAFFGKVVNKWCDDKLTELTWLDEGPDGWCDGKLTELTWLDKGPDGPGARVVLTGQMARLWKNLIST